MGVWLNKKRELRNKSSIIWMEIFWGAKIKNSMSSPIKYKGPSNCFLRLHWIVHHKFLPSGHIINKEYYLEVLCNFLEAIQKKPTLWRDSFLYTTVLGKNITLLYWCNHPFSSHGPLWLSCFPILQRHSKDYVFQHDKDEIAGQAQNHN